MTIDFRVSVQEFYKFDLDEVVLRSGKVSSAYFKAEILRKSLDARGKSAFFNLRVKLFESESDYANRAVFQVNHASSLKGEVHIIGAGPAGLFAGLKAIELGIKPIIYERGKSVRDRRRDLVQITRNGKVDEDSNYCFGEGGAGTYSDGKLYTRSKKRGSILEVLNLLVAFGADSNILYEAHPHIGTNKLPGIIENIRNYILQEGGEVHFNTRVTDFYIDNGHVKGLQLNNAISVNVDNVILATGHSARDIFELLDKRGVALEAKTFAMGVRIEHPQDLISGARIKNKMDRGLLPPASYSWVEQVNGVGVFSFCMCPGGIIAPCATSQEEVVTNGWSPSKRNNPFANSGIVVQIDPNKFGWKDTFDGLNYQKELEYRAWELGGKNQFVPAQKLTDFLKGERSSDLAPSSYRPGITSVELSQVLPNYIGDKLRQAFLQVGKKWSSYISEEAMLHAPESRTSSPLRIPRNEFLEHTEVSGLYPCAEGAGYAGGIVSAAIDGMRCVEAISNKGR